MKTIGKVAGAVLILAIFGFLFWRLSESTRGRAPLPTVVPTVVASAMPLPKLTETPKATGTSTPTKIPTVAATATVGRVIPPTEVCRVGALPGEAVGKFPWMETPVGSNEFVEFRSLPFSGSEKLNGLFKTKGAALYCQTDKNNAQYPLWWRAK